MLAQDLHSATGLRLHHHQAIPRSLPVGPGATAILSSLLTGLLLMKKITSVCPYCGAGCKLKLVVDNNKIIRAEAADGVTNQNQLCLKGYYGWDFLNDTQLLTPRLKQPMIRYQKGGAFTPVSWQEAIRYTASKLREIKEKHGPRAIMTTGSSRGTGNETNYVMQ